MVQAAEIALQKFQEQEGFPNLEERRALLDQKLKDLGGALNAAKTRRLEKEAAYQEMSSAGNVEELPGVLKSQLAAFFRDYLDTSVGRPSDVKMLGLPLLGVIPETTARRTQALLGELGREPFAEGYRVLRTALHPAPRLENGQLLLVTSARAGEGKTLTALNLALSLAQTEEKVLLVDADLRRPSMHTLLPARRVPGLSDVLTGSADALQAVQRVPGTRLNLLACGAPVNVSTTDLLATGALRELFDTLRWAYDRIVVDTPPAGTIADALVLAPLADGVLVVARSGKVARSAVLQVLDRIFNAGGNVMGVILNRARPDRHHYDYGSPMAPEPFRRSPRRSLAPPREPTSASSFRRS